MSLFATALTPIRAFYALITPFTPKSSTSVNIDILLILNFRNDLNEYVYKQKNSLPTNLSQNIKLFVESQHKLGDLKTMFTLYIFPSVLTLYLLP